MKKNIILKTTAWIAFIVCMISACAVDSNTWAPLIIFCISATYLMLFAYANGWLGERRGS